MSDDIILIGRIVIQGPQTPLPGIMHALPVYRYEAQEAARDIRKGATIDVAHQDADSDDAGFAVGAVRRLWLLGDLPEAVDLWLAEGMRPNGRVWFCRRSELVSAAGTEGGQ